jgi:hypothetical protein
MRRELELVEGCAREVFSGGMIPYLGAGVAALGDSRVPSSPAALCRLIEAEVRAPRRAAGNLWAVAQFVESRRFRATLNAIVERAFEGGVRDNPVHAWVATARPPLVVDAWYDDGLLGAYAARSQSWGWTQGVSRNGEWIDIWTRAYGADGVERPEGPDGDWRSLVYKPHGMARKGSSFLMSDSDYVEVLTEIDIQTPIPEEVRRRRQARGFLFLGCRFDDQMLRIFARQILKRSGGRHVAVIEGPLTRMEAKFLAEQGIQRVDLPLDEAVAALGALA